MSKTLFQKIADGEIPADIVYEDDRALAFRDINPQAPTHLLIVPRKPIPRADAIEEADEALIGHLFTVARKRGRRRRAERLPARDEQRRGRRAVRLPHPPPPPRRARPAVAARLTSPPDRMIHVQNVHVAFDGKEVLHGVSFHVGAGPDRRVRRPQRGGQDDDDAPADGHAQARRRADRARAAWTWWSTRSRRSGATGSCPSTATSTRASRRRNTSLFIGRMYGLDEALVRTRLGRAPALLEARRRGAAQDGRLLEGDEAEGAPLAPASSTPRPCSSSTSRSPGSTPRPSSSPAPSSAAGPTPAAPSSTPPTSSTPSSASPTASIVIRDGRIIGEGSPEDLKAETASASLELAFSQLTSTEDVTARTDAVHGRAGSARRYRHDYARRSPAASAAGNRRRAASSRPSARAWSTPTPRRSG